MTEMKVKLTQFGDYKFENVISATTNFTDFLDSWSNVPDADGAFDDQGSGRGLQSKGVVKAEFILEATDPVEMRKKKDTFLKIASKGPRPLWYLPDDPIFPPRFCRARIRNIDMDENSDNADSMQHVKIEWSVGFPRWLSRPHVNYLGDSDLSGDVALVDQESYYLGYSANFDSAQNLTLYRVQAQVKDGTRIQVLNSGNAPAPAVLQIRGSRPWTLGEGLHYGDAGVFIGGYGSAQVTNPQVTWFNEVGDTVGKFTWYDVLGVNELLEINALNGNSTLFQWPNYSRSGLPALSITAGVGFLILDPGINTIRVNGIFSGPFGFLNLDWDDAWF